MKFALTLAACLTATGAMATPVTNAQAAIKIGCESIHTRLPSSNGTCNDLVAVLRGDVWTVSQKQLPSNIIGGGAPVVEVSQENGEVLNFYLTE
jgi:hypothetical protein